MQYSNSKCLLTNIKQYVYVDSLMLWNYVFYDKELSIVAEPVPIKTKKWQNMEYKDKKGLKFFYALFKTSKVKFDLHEENGNIVGRCKANGQWKAIKTMGFYTNGHVIKFTARIGERGEKRRIPMNYDEMKKTSRDDPSFDMNINPEIPGRFVSIRKPLLNVYTYLRNQDGNLVKVYL